MNYRSITLMDTAYKIYASILNERMKYVVEMKLEEGQFEFRQGRESVDAIYVMNYIVNEGLAKKKGKVFTFFVDLKAAFDNVDRVKLRRMMRKIGIRGKGRLRKKIMEMYKQTKNIVRVGERKSEEFWAKKGVKQGNPMNPTLINVYMRDMEEEMKKERTGGIVIGKEKIWTIPFADDVVLLAKREENLKAMMRDLRDI